MKAEAGRLGTFNRSAVLLLGSAILVAYANTFNVPFLLDDVWRIETNKNIHSLTRLPEAFRQSNRSLVNVTFALNYAWHGLKVPGYHVTNLAIHLLAGYCLYGCVRRALLLKQNRFSARAATIACAVALIWSLHPLQTSAVTYINQRFQSMMGLMFLATFYFFIRAVESRRSRFWYSASIAACAAGMLCKEDMVAAPLLVLWFDRAFVSDDWRNLFRRRWRYYSGLAATWAVLAWEMLHFVEEYTNGGMLWVSGTTPWTYLLTQSEVVVHYIRTAFWPVGQSFVFDWPIVTELRRVVPEFGFLAGTVLLTVWLTIRAPRLGFIGGWFFLILAPTSSIFPILDVAFEHRMYLPLASLAVIFVLGMEHLLTMPTALKSGLANGRNKAWVYATIVVTLMALTLRRNHDFRSELAIWEATLKQNAGNAKAWQGLACAQVKLGRSSDARRSFEKAAELSPRSSIHKTNYAVFLYENGELDRAEGLLLEALEIAPTDILTLRTLGNLMMDQGRVSEGIDYCRRALQMKPADFESRASLSAALIADNRFESAVEVCRAGLAIDPKSVKTRVNLAIALARQGKTSEATVECKAAIQIDSKLVQPYVMLSSLLEKSDFEQATGYAEQALALEPDSLELKQNLARLLSQVRPAEAIRLYREVIEVSPEAVDVRFKLVSSLLLSQKFDEAIAEMEKIVALRPESRSAQEYLERIRAYRRR